ncbi:MAG: hypothetical protein JST59_00355 [Actinobacteria bacterium]|nr:hypothetical protein [Actinomycetota bacterium]
MSDDRGTSFFFFIVTGFLDFFLGLVVGFTFGVLLDLQLSRLLKALLTTSRFFRLVNRSLQDLLCRWRLAYRSATSATLNLLPIFRAAISSNSSAHMLFSSYSCLFSSFVAKVCSLVLIFSRLVVYAELTLFVVYSSLSYSCWLSPGRNELRSAYGLSPSSIFFKSFLRFALPLSSLFWLVGREIGGTVVLLFAEDLTVVGLRSEGRTSGAVDFFRCITQIAMQLFIVYLLLFINQSVRAVADKLKQWLRFRNKLGRWLLRTVSAEAIGSARTAQFAMPEMVRRVLGGATNGRHRSLDDGVRKLDDATLQRQIRFIYSLVIPSPPWIPSCPSLSPQNSSFSFSSCPCDPSLFSWTSSFSPVLLA